MQPLAQSRPAMSEWWSQALPILIIVVCGFEFRLGAWHRSLCLLGRGFPSASFQKWSCWVKEHAGEIAMGPARSFPNGWAVRIFSGNRQKWPPPDSPFWNSSEVGFRDKV